MTLQHHLSFLPPDAEIVSKHLAVNRSDGKIIFFNASGPIYICGENDSAAVRVAAAVLTDPQLHLAKPKEIARALRCHRSRVFEHRKRFKEVGVTGLQPKRTGPRGASKLKGTVLARAQKYLNQGLSSREVARKVGVSEGTIRGALRAERLVRPSFKASTSATQEAASTPRERSDEDRSCEGGIAVKRGVDRALAHAGRLVEAAPKFEPAESVAKAGVLVALPALLGQGLIEVGQGVYGTLKNGYFGLTSILLAFGFMALIRIKSLEGLTNHVPGELGLALGLDRVPEMKTARRKLAELAGRGLALEFSRTFSERWATASPEALGYL